MIVYFDNNDNSILLDNGDNLTENPLKVKASSVCSGEYTDFILTLPKNTEIFRGKRKLKNTQEPWVLRIKEK